LDSCNARDRPLVALGQFDRKANPVAVKDPSTFYEGSMSTDSGARVDKLIVDPVKLQFVGEQDGTLERDLKVRLVTVLQQHETVDFAYLARIQYSDEDTCAVALCLRCSWLDQVEHLSTT